MAVFKVDTDQLNTAISKYNTEINNLKVVIKKIQDSMDNLKESGWDSNASKQYFKVYEDTWLINLKLYIRVLEQLKEDLEIAKEEYSKLEQAFNDYNNCI